MWSFGRKKTIGETALLTGGTDFHSHILPGVDDGVEDHDTALRILDRYAATGIQELWLTPHIMEDYPNTPKVLKERFAQLQEAYKGPITLHLAAEYMLDNFFEETLENNNLLPIGKEGNHLLVETSYYTPPMRLYDVLERIKRKGYHPLFAHAERYLYLEKTHYEELREMGIKLQLNLPSLAGVYGNEIQKKALWLLDKEMYAVTGSDTHCDHATTVIENIALKGTLRDKLQRIIKRKL